MRRPAYFSLAVFCLALGTACSNAPDLPPLPESNAGYPRLAPLSEVLAGTQEAPESQDEIDALAARAADLRARTTN